MDCCAECFDDPFLRELCARVGTDAASCPCCGSPHVRVVPAKDLTDYFEPLLSVYQIDASPKSEPLQVLLKRDWGFFLNVADATAQELLQELLPDVAQEDHLFIGRPSLTTTVLADWESFRNELKYKNRFFPELSLAKDGEGMLFGKCLGADESQVPSEFYRGRMCEPDSPYGPDAMGAPPKKLATSGRANPRGIPYLYVASDKETAIHELRPHPGEHVCVAHFAITDKLHLADLRNPQKTVSPFRLEESELVEYYGHIPYLSELGRELSEPVLPRAAELEYLPSQYLSEFIKHCGFDGLIYESAMGSGTNYALFSEDKVKAMDVTMYRIDATNVDFSAVPV